MPAEIRKIVTLVDECRREGTRPATSPWIRVACAVVLTNPWIQLDYVEDLSEEVALVGPVLAQALSQRILSVAGAPAAVQAFGKAAIVGTSGEIEHGAALMHNPHLGDGVRHYLQGTSILPFSEARGEAGTVLAVPMWHKTAHATRSHYQAFEVRVQDAPRHDELIIVVAASTGPRPHARIGDRKTDRKVEVQPCT